MATEHWLRDAGERLRAWIEKNSTQAAFAKKLGVSQQTVSAWCRGVLAPGPLQRVLIRRITGQPSSAWVPPHLRRLLKLTPAEERELEAHCRADAAADGTKVA